jgi:hypothetical protein
MKQTGYGVRIMAVIPRGEETVVDALVSAWRYDDDSEDPLIEGYADRGGWWRPNLPDGEYFIVVGRSLLSLARPGLRSATMRIEFPLKRDVLIYLRPTFELRGRVFPPGEVRRLAGTRPYVQLRPWPAVVAVAIDEWVRRSGRSHGGLRRGP